MRLSELVEFAKECGYDDPILRGELFIGGNGYYDPDGTLALTTTFKIGSGEGPKQDGTSYIDLQLTFKRWES